MSYDGHGKLMAPVLNHDGRYRSHQGYVTDIMNELAVDFLERQRTKPFSLFFAHKAVHPDAVQAGAGTLTNSAQRGYVVPRRHRNLYRGKVFPRTPNMLSPAEVIRNKPAWKECFSLKEGKLAKKVLKALHAGTQEEIRLRACMMASVDEASGGSSRRWRRRGSWTTPASSSSATTATSSASTPSARRGASRTRTASARPSPCASRRS